MLLLEGHRTVRNQASPRSGIELLTFEQNEKKTAPSLLRSVKVFYLTGRFLVTQMEGIPLVLLLIWGILANFGRHMQWVTLED